jgi:hypothetical protein
VSLLNTLVLVWSLIPLAGMFLALWYSSALRGAEERSEARAAVRARHRD